MIKRFPWLPAALFGALLGAVVGIGAESVVDPSGNRDATYGDSTRLLFVLRYVGFGLIAGGAVWLIAERVRRPRSVSTSKLVAAWGAMAVCAVAAIYPVANDEEPAPPANVRATFRANCVKLTGQDQKVSATEAGNYCKCLVASLARDLKGDALNRLIADLNRSLAEGTSAPKEALKAVGPCAEQVGIR